MLKTLFLIVLKGYNTVLKSVSKMKNNKKTGSSFLISGNRLFTKTTLIILKPIKKLNLSSKHSALLIALLIGGTLLLFLFNLTLSTKSIFVAESYYLIETEEEEKNEEEKKAAEIKDQNKNAKPETNRAFNETKKTTRLAKAYRPIAPPPIDDFDVKDLPQMKAAKQKPQKILKKSKISDEERSKFDEANILLEKLKAVEKRNKETNKGNSSVKFSLANRKNFQLPIPVYRCEKSGKVEVKIIVNSSGKVISASILNTTSNNKCLTGQALMYAKQAEFSADPSQNRQKGSITFSFIGK